MARNAPVTEEQPDALPSAAIATQSNLNRLSSLESQRSSIILPNSGAIPAHTDLYRDYSANMELVAVEANGVGSSVIDQGKACLWILRFWVCLYKVHDDFWSRLRVGHLCSY